MINTFFTGYRNVIPHPSFDDEGAVREDTGFRRLRETQWQ
jgi:hypothetical protein